MKIGYKLVLFIILLLMGLTFYIYEDYSGFKGSTQEQSEGAIVISDGNLSVNFNEGSTFSLKDLKDGYTLEKKFSITNNGKSTLYYTITLNDIDYGISSSSKVKYSITSDNEGASINNEDFPNDASEITGLIAIGPETTQTYKIKITFSGKSSSGDSLSATILVKKKDKSGRTFSDVILSNNSIKKAETKPGKEIAIDDEGLIESSDDNGTSYYFRGNVTNNYVSFANQMWRIVKINGDKSIKLILDDTLTEELAYNTNTVENEGDDPSVLSSFDDSTIRKKLDTWYSTNISQYAKYVVNSKFCLDKNVSKEDGTNKYYNSYVRVMEDENPLYNCIGTNYSANIGLLTVDEAIFAGSYKNTENKNSYLYNPNITTQWWLLNPYSISSDNVVRVFVFNGLDATVNSGADIKSTKSIRPVINIRDNVYVKGNGTKNDPYVIQ